ncbi:MAG: hypothetical protein DHS20C01_24480 [marine bacterium B5-7]|nr:MAG: hypothetical protein DHS20C01_24480 [marine bacterium B5-7]
MNPMWRWQFFDDEEIDAYLKIHFDSDLLRVFRAFPLGVMRADTWRYAVLFIEGGLYTDLDTECCIALDDWLPCDAQLVVGVEVDDAHFCQWTVAAAPRQIILKTTLELIVTRAWNGVDTSNPHFVHYHTGPSIWTDAFRQHFEAPSVSLPELTRIAAQSTDGIVVLKPGALRDQYVRHEFGSQCWRDETDYFSWVAEADNYLPVNRTRPQGRDGWQMGIDDDGYYLYHRDTLCRLNCNDITAWLYDYFDGTRSVGNAIAELKSQVPDAPDDVDSQVRSILRKLARLGVIII